MCVQFNSDEIMIFYVVKVVFDFDGLLNSGKNIFMLYCCVEFGVMYVYYGYLFFFELECF